MRLLRMPAAAVATVLCSASCVPSLIPPRLEHQMALAEAQAKTDAQLGHQLDLARDRATLPGATFADLEGWAGTFEAVWDTGAVLRGAVDGYTHADGLFEQLAPWQKQPQTKARALAWKGRILLRLDRYEEALAALDASLDAGPTTLAALPLVEHLGSTAAWDAVPGTCRKARPGMKTDEERALLLDRCAKASGQRDPAKALAWASEEDRAFHEEQLRLAEERQAAREQAQKERLEAHREASAARSSARSESGSRAESPAPAPSHGRVEIVSECRRSVRLFFGETPKFGSGRYTTWGANTRGQETVGRTVWLVDERDNGLASAQVGPGTKQVVILSSCQGLGTR